MQNPYSHSVAGPATPEQQKLSDYEMAIGPNTELLHPEVRGIRQGRLTARLELAGLLRDGP